MKNPTKTPVANSVPFDNSTNGFAATNLQAAIEEIGAGAAQPNFSYHYIATDLTIKINQYQHMICTHLEIDGFLDLEGSLVFL